MRNKSTNVEIAITTSASGNDRPSESFMSSRNGVVPVTSVANPGSTARTERTTERAVSPCVSPEGTTSITVVSVDSVGRGDTLATPGRAASCAT